MKSTWNVDNTNLVRRSGVLGLQTVQDENLPEVIMQLATIKIIITLFYFLILWNANTRCPNYTYCSIKMKF